jgi:hypothetical protein
MLPLGVLFIAAIITRYRKRRDSNDPSLLHALGPSTHGGNFNSIPNPLLISQKHVRIIPQALDGEQAT